jgi:hypothetical protein
MKKYDENISTEEAKKFGEFEGKKQASYKSKMAKDPNLEGDAKTLGDYQADKTIQQAKGLQDSQVYNKDGSEGKEHSKFMEGGSFLMREKINKEELAAGAAIHNKDEETRKQMMADVQASSAGRMLDEFSKAKGTRKGLNVTHDKDGSIVSVENTKDIEWTDTNGDLHKMSRARAYELLGQAGIFGDVGKGAAIDVETNKEFMDAKENIKELIRKRTQAIENKEPKSKIEQIESEIEEAKENLKRVRKKPAQRDFSKIINNAYGGEMANIEGMNSAIKALGGAENFAAFKGKQAQIQTTEAFEAMSGKLAQHLLKTGEAKSLNEANELARKILTSLSQGGDELANKIKADNSSEALSIKY